MEFDAWGPPKSWTGKQIKDFKKKMFPDRWIKKLDSITDGLSLLEVSDSMLKRCGFKTAQAIGMIIRLCTPVLELANKGERDAKEAKASAKSKKKKKKKAASNDPEPWELMDVSEPADEKADETPSEAPSMSVDETPKEEEKAPQSLAEASAADDGTKTQEQLDEEAFLQKSRERAKARKEEKAKKKAAKAAAEAEKNAKLEAQREEMAAQEAKDAEANAAKMEEEERLKAEKEAAKKPADLAPLQAYMAEKKLGKPTEKMFQKAKDKSKKALEKIRGKIKSKMLLEQIGDMMDGENPAPEEDEDVEGGVENWPPGTKVKIMGEEITWNDPLLNGFGKIKYAIHTEMEDNYIVEVKDRAELGFSTDITVPSYKLEDLVRVPSNLDEASGKCIIECLKIREKYVKVCAQATECENAVNALVKEMKGYTKKQAAKMSKAVKKKRNLSTDKEELLEKRRKLIQDIKEAEGKTNKTLEWGERFGNCIYLDGITDRPSHELKDMLEELGLEVDKIGPVEASRNDYKLGCVVYLKSPELAVYAASIKSFPVAEDVSEDCLLKITMPVPQNMGNVVKAMKYMKRVRAMM